MFVYNLQIILCSSYAQRLLLLLIGMTHFLHLSVVQALIITSNYNLIERSTMLLAADLTNWFTLIITVVQY